MTNSPATKTINKVKHGRGNRSNVKRTFISEHRSKDEAINSLRRLNEEKGLKILCRNKQEDMNVFYRCPNYRRKACCKYSASVLSDGVKFVVNETEHSEECLAQDGTKGLSKRIKEIIGDSYQYTTAQNVVSKVRNELGERVSEHTKKQIRAFTNNSRYQLNRTEKSNTVGALHRESEKLCLNAMLKRHEGILDEILNLIKKRKQDILQCYNAPKKEDFKLKHSILNELWHSDGILLSLIMLRPRPFADWAVSQDRETASLGSKLNRFLREVVSLGVKSTENVCRMELPDGNSIYDKPFSFALSTIGLLLNKIRNNIHTKISHVEADSRFKNFRQKNINCQGLGISDKEKTCHLWVWALSNAESGPTYMLTGDLAVKGTLTVCKFIREFLVRVGVPDAHLWLWKEDEVKKLSYVRSDGFTGIRNGLSKCFCAQNIDQNPDDIKMEILAKEKLVDRQPVAGDISTSIHCINDKIHVLKAASSAPARDRKRIMGELNQIANCTNAAMAVAAHQMHCNKYSNAAKYSQTHKEYAANHLKQYGIESLRPFWCLGFTPSMEVNYTSGIERKNREYKEKVSKCKLRNVMATLGDLYQWLSDETDNSISKNEYYPTKLKPWWTPTKVLLSIKEAELLTMILVPGKRKAYPVPYENSFFTPVAKHKLEEYYTIAEATYMLGNRNKASSMIALNPRRKLSINKWSMSVKEEGISIQIQTYASLKSREDVLRIATADRWASNIVSLYTTKDTETVKAICKNDVGNFFDWLEFAVPVEKLNITKSGETKSRTRAAHLQAGGFRCYCIEYHRYGLCSDIILRIIEENGPGVIPDEFSSKVLSDQITWIRRLPERSALLFMEQLEITRKRERKQEEKAKEQEEQQKEKMERLEGMLNSGSRWRIEEIKASPDKPLGWSQMNKFEFASHKRFGTGVICCSDDLNLEEDKVKLRFSGGVYGEFPLSEVDPVMFWRQCAQTLEEKCELAGDEHTIESKIDDNANAYATNVDVDVTVMCNGNDSNPGTMEKDDNDSDDLLTEDENEVEANDNQDGSAKALHSIDVTVASYGNGTNTGTVEKDENDLDDLLNDDNHENTIKADVNIYANADVDPDAKAADISSDADIDPNDNAADVNTDVLVNAGVDSVQDDSDAEIKVVQIKKHSTCHSMVPISKLNFKKIKGDGNCWIRCISWALYGNEDQYVVLKESMIKYIRDDEEGRALAPILCRTKSRKEFLKWISPENAFGDESCFRVLAYIYGILPYIFSHVNGPDKECVTIQGPRSILGPALHPMIERKFRRLRPVFLYYSDLHYQIVSNGDQVINFHNHYAIGKENKSDCDLLNGNAAESESSSESDEEESDFSLDTKSNAFQKARRKAFSNPSKYMDRRSYRTCGSVLITQKGQYEFSASMEKWINVTSGKHRKCTSTLKAYDLVLTPKEGIGIVCSREAQNFGVYIGGQDADVVPYDSSKLLKIGHVNVRRSTMLLRSKNESNLGLKRTRTRTSPRTPSGNKREKVK